MVYLAVFEDRICESWRHLQGGTAFRFAVALTLVSVAALVAGCHSANKQSGENALPFKPPAGTDDALINVLLDDLIKSNVFRIAGPSDRNRYQLIFHVQSRRPTSILNAKKIRSEARLSQVKVLT